MDQVNWRLGVKKSLRVKPLNQRQKPKGTDPCGINYAIVSNFIDLDHVVLIMKLCIYIFHVSIMI